MALSKSQMENISGLGPAKADSLYNGLRKNEKLIEEILKNGVTIKQKIVGKLTGKKIAITGSTKMKRAELEKMIHDHGGEYKSSVSKECTHLIIADVNSTSAKAVSARKLHITLITEEDFLNMARK
jgi:DNA ligase (NAD+)